MTDCEPLALIVVMLLIYWVFRERSLVAIIPLFIVYMLYRSYVAKQRARAGGAE